MRPPPPPLRRRSDRRNDALNLKRLTLNVIKTGGMRDIILWRRGRCALEERLTASPVTPSQ